MLNHFDNEWFIVCPRRCLTVWFITNAPLAVQIKYVMKSLNTTPNHSFRFHAARNAASAAKKSKSLPAPVHFVDMVPNRKKFKDVLISKKDPAIETGQNNATALKPKKHGKSRVGKSSSDSLIRTEFSIQSASASSVRLAADFTGWEKSPVDLVKSEHGIWHAVVPLPPGDYSYRYIVDGKWCDDPHCEQGIPNPFGTVNAVISVTAT
jgi:hypothetical protein